MKPRLDDQMIGNFLALFKRIVPNTAPSCSQVIQYMAQNRILDPQMVRNFVIVARYEEWLPKFRGSISHTIGEIHEAVTPLSERQLQNIVWQWQPKFTASILQKTFRSSVHYNPDKWVRHYLASIGCSSEETEQFVHQCIAAGLTDAKRFRYYLVYKEYPLAAQNRNGIFYLAKLDLAQKYDLSLKTIDTIVYKWRYMFENFGSSAKLHPKKQRPAALVAQ